MKWADNIARGKNDRRISSFKASGTTCVASIRFHAARQVIRRVCSLIMDFTAWMPFMSPASFISQSASLYMAESTTCGCRIILPPACVGTDAEISHHPHSLLMSQPDDFGEEIMLEARLLGDDTIEQSRAVHTTRCFIGLFIA